MKRRAFRADDLVLASLREHWQHTLRLMRLANAKVEGARRIAMLSLDRYFERLAEGA